MAGATDNGAREMLKSRRAVVLALISIAVVPAACSSEGSTTNATATASTADASTEGASPTGLGAPKCVSAFTAGVPKLDAQGCVAKPQAPDRLDEALAKLGKDRCTLTYPPTWRDAFTFTKDAYRLSYVDEIHDHPLLLPGFAKNLGADLDLAAASERPVAEAIALAQARLGKPVAEACDPGAELVGPATEAAPLARAIADLLRGAGADADDDALTAGVAAVPLELQRALSPIVRILGEGPAAQAKALGPYADLKTELLKVSQLVVRGKAFNVGGARVRDALRDFDTGAMATYAARLALAVESANLTRFRDVTGFEVTVPTPLGSIVLRDGAKHTYSPNDAAIGSDVLLVLDTGGDDTYRIPAGAPQNGKAVSVAIDLGGKDRYGYDEVPNAKDGARLPSDAAGRYTPVDVPKNDDGPVSLSTTPRQGAGLLGVGMLFDLGTEGDSYRSLRMSQGFGGLGVGVLYDAGGDDVYEVEALGQGSAMFGIGLSIDVSGKDVRRTYYTSQGFGYVRGFGALVDKDGDDEYLADVGDPAFGGDPLYWTPQIPGRGNQSFSQGVGYGRRDDATEHYMSGGIGVLRDYAGNDRYRASVASQASGYWFGTGLLLDRAGNDRYDDFYYTQATTAHFAHAVLLDEGGDDEINQELPPTATGPGVGHDFGVAFLIDLGGNDKVRANVLGLGAGNDNGIGVFLNIGGDDTYRGETDSLGGRCYGAAMGSDPSLNRGGWPTYGLFLDVGGSDTYTVQAKAATRDGTSWAGPTSGRPESKDLGAGLDVNDGTAELP